MRADEVGPARRQCSSTRRLMLERRGDYSQEVFEHADSQEQGGRITVRPAGESPIRQDAPETYTPNASKISVPTLLGRRVTASIMHQVE